MPSNSCMPYQPFTKQLIQLITYNNNYFITYFSNKNQDVLLRKGCTNPATHHKRRQPPRHKCRHTLLETLPSPMSDLFSHPSHQQQIRWCCTHRLRELSFLRKEGHRRVWTRSKKESSRANSCGSECTCVVGFNCGSDCTLCKSHTRSCGLESKLKKKNHFF